jgi:hypothetical protein
VVKETETTWVDENNNSWNKAIYTKEQAEKHSATMINCSYCSDCRGCSYCSDCSEFKANPERIASPVMGSRESQTVVYWVAEDVQVVCGCFRGGLVKFREQVIATHGDNDHGIAYLAWIDRVERYIGAGK